MKTIRPDMIDLPLHDPGVAVAVAFFVALIATRIWKEVF